MPFQSEAQRRKFHELVAKGEMDPKVLHQWEKDTPPGKLPERKPVALPVAKPKKRKHWRIK